MQVKQHVHGKFHILSFADPLKAEGWRLKTYLAKEISLNNT